MIKKFLFLFVISASILGISKAQNAAYSAWTTQELQQANTGANCSFLSDVEKEIILLMNLARLDGVKFRESFAKGYLGDKMSSNISSLYSDLENVKNRPMLHLDANLCKAASYHAVEMGNSGNTGHKSLDGTEFYKRMENFGYPFDGPVAENCSYGYGDAIGIVMQLLVDENVSSLGHRKNILSPEYKAVGISLCPHKNYSFNCVQDFGSRVVAPVE